MQLLCVLLVQMRKRDGKEVDRVNRAARLSACRLFNIHKTRFSKTLLSPIKWLLTNSSATQQLSQSQLLFLSI